MSEGYSIGGEFVWHPTADYINQAHLTLFMRQQDIVNFDTLMQ